MSEAEPKLEKIVQGAVSPQCKVWWTRALVETQLSVGYFEPEDPGVAGELIRETVDRYKGVPPQGDDFWWVTARAQAIATYEEFSPDIDEQKLLDAEMTARRQHAADLEEVAHWRHDDGMPLTLEDQEVAADGLEAARVRFRETQREYELDVEYPISKDASARVQSNRRIENQMIKIVEQILKGEQNV